LKNHPLQWLFNQARFDNLSWQHPMALRLRAPSIAINTVYPEKYRANNAEFLLVLPYLQILDVSTSTRQFGAKVTAVRRA
jgi:hypothetical protein